MLAPSNTHTLPSKPWAAVRTPVAPRLHSGPAPVPGPGQAGPGQPDTSLKLALGLTDPTGEQGGHVPVCLAAPLPICVITSNTPFRSPERLNFEGEDDAAGQPTHGP